MTPRKARFVAEYVRKPNATQAAIKAGYSEKTAYAQGHALLKNVEVRAALAAANASGAQIVAEKLAEAAGSAAWIISQAVEIVGEARAAEQYSAANGALALLAKRFPEFRDNVTVDNSQHVHLPAGLTVDELKQLASGD